MKSRGNSLALFCYEENPVGSMRKILILIISTIIISCQESYDKVEPSEGPKTLFSILNASHTNLAFKNIIPENERMNSWTYEYYYNGGGVSAGDVNKDGLPDIYLTGNVTPNRLYLNQGNFKFKDVTDLAGLKDTPSWTTGTAMVDINNDGILDIYVCRSGKLSEDQRRNLFYVSTGLKGGIPTYTNHARALGLDDPSYSTQAAFFDFDRDGDLDMYLLNHNVDVKPFYEVEELKKKRDPFIGDKLFRNDNGKFVDISAIANIQGNEIGYGLGVSIGDLNNDGWPDIYVANDYSEHDYLYINQKDGTFSEQSKAALKQMSNYAMGTDIADINNDGLLDIMTLDMVAEDNYGIKTSMSGMNHERFQTHLDNGLQHQYMYNTLQLNRGNGQFSEIGQLAGVHSTDWSWAPLLFDIDLDGQKDLFVTNGLKRDFRNNDYRKYKMKRLEQAESDQSVNKAALIKELVALTPQKKIANYVFRNTGNLQFENQQQDWGIGLKTYSNGLAYADFDNDGDLDLIANNIDQEPTVYKNNTLDINTNHYLKVQLKGNKENIDGLGARVTIWADTLAQLQEHFLTRGYQSSVDKGLWFGLGPHSQIDSLEVIWPDGSYQKVSQIMAADQTCVLKYPEAAQVQKEEKIASYTEDLTHKVRLNYLHRETAFNDYERESLLPHAMSELGPGLAVADVNRDGLQDLFVGGAKGFAGQLFLQNPDQTFAKSSDQPWVAHKNAEDMSALFFDANEDQWPDLYVVSGSNEDPEGSINYRDRLYLNKNGVLVDASQRLPDIRISGYTVEAADYDEDGDMDLFVGGRQRPGRYPMPESSYIWTNVGGKFENHTDSIAPELEDLGMVTDAMWVDYNSDGQKDLVLVGEWMPLTVFENTNGKFSKKTIPGAENTVGWWYSIAAADFDGDGDMDFVMGNNGLNYKYKATSSEPFSMYASDFDQNQSLDIVLGYYNKNQQFPLRGRECLSNQMPFIKEKFPTYHDFGSASLEEVYDKTNLDNALQYHATTFASSYVENKGEEGMKITPLPIWGQFSSTNKILIQDVDQDSNLDLLIAGNLYQSEVETPRNDASHGAILLGNGNGGFKYKGDLGLNDDIKDMVKIRLGNDVQSIAVAANQGPLRIMRLLR